MTEAGAFDRKLYLRDYMRRYNAVPENNQRINARVRSTRRTPEGWLRQSLNAARKRAKKAGQEFTIEIGDIEMPSHCPITLRAFSFSAVVGGDDDNPSLDRVDNARGYVKGNVRVISKGANRAKSNITDPAVFERLAAYTRGAL